MVRAHVGPLKLKNMFKLKNLFVTLVASIIVMFACVLMWFFVSHEASITSFITGLIGIFLLNGAIEYWEKAIRGWFKMEEPKKNNN